MDNFKKSYVKYSSRSIPTTIFDNCNELEILFKDWLKAKRPVGECVGLLMYKLGVLSDGSENVRFYNYNKNNYSFDCIVNNSEIYNIKLKNLNLPGFNPEIVLSKGNEIINFVCIPMEHIELGMRVVKTSYNIKENGIGYTRYLSTENALFNIEKNGYVMEFGVSKPSNVLLRLFDKDGRYSKYELDNENKLIEYLTSLEFPISIVDVYKEICKITLFDVSKYPRILLKISKVDNFGSVKIMDLIHLEKGQLENFGMTNYDTGKTLFLNKDGSWSFEIEDRDYLIDFSMEVKDGKINYNIGIKDGNDLGFVKSIIEDNIGYANKEVENVRVLVRKLFDGRGK